MIIKEDKIKKLALFTILILLNSAFASVDLTCKAKWDLALDEHTIKDIYKGVVGLCGSNFKKELGLIISKNTNNSYHGARLFMFSKLDNFDGEVCSVYSKRCVETEEIPNHLIMNCEHSWPQSLGAIGVAKADVHHLYPVMAKMNSRRSNHPFCEVEDAVYSEHGSRLGESKYGTRCFEPPSFHKGNLARSMFYFSIRYGKIIDSEQELFFRQWTNEDGVDVEESKRNESISKFQKNRNPFVDHPWFVGFIDNF